MNKSLENSQIPDDWVRTNVGDLCLKIHYGFTATTTEKDTGVKFLRITDITDSGVDWNKVPFCKIDEDRVRRYRLEENDIVFARTGGTVGKSFLIKSDVPNNTVFASYLIRLKASKSVNPKFLAYYFQSKRYWEYIQMNKTGLKTNVNAQILANMDFPLPPFNEQNRIVVKLDELLSELEKGKQQLQIVLEQLQVYRQLVLKTAFEGKLTEQWRSKQTKLKAPNELVNAINSYRKQHYEEQLKLYKVGKIKIKPKEAKAISLPGKEETSNKPTLPAGWLYLYLKDLCVGVDRVNIKEKNGKENFLYLDIGGINNDKNVIERYKQYTWKDAPSRAQQIVKLNDILFSTVRTYMRNIAMVLDDKFTDQIASSGFTVIRGIEGIVSPKYLFKHLLSDKFITPLNELQTGSSYPAVRDTDVFNQVVPICSLEEQSLVSDLIDAKYSVIENLERIIDESIIQSESLRLLLLKKAFEGSLVEPNLNEEPAALLLKRIRKEREEYSNAEKQREKAYRPLYIKTKRMAEQLKRIVEILGDSKEPMSARTVWQTSIHKDDIEGFYAELKVLVEAGKIIELPRTGKESFIQLASYDENR